MIMKLLKRVTMLASLILVSLAVSNVTKAATLNISTSKSIVKPGESFKVTVSVSNGAGYVSASVSNGNGGFGSTWLENGSKSFTCKAGSSGNVTIKTSGTIADFTTEKDESASKSKTVKIQEEKKIATTNKVTTTSAKTSKKTETTKKVVESKLEEEKVKKDIKKDEEERYLLKSLEIEDLSLTPEFNGENLEYEVRIKDKEQLNINYETNKRDVIVEVIGNERLNLGENTITINLKGQDDKQITTYIIKVLKEKSELDLANEEINKLQLINMVLLAIIIALLGSIIALTIIYKKKH